MFAIMIATLALQAEPRVLTHVDFARPPMPEVPGAALSRGIPSGYATVECSVEAGAITACTIVDEDPAGIRFGVMLLSEMRRARLKPEIAAEVTRFRLTARFVNRSL
ncbi:MAG: hypothetical protein IBJ02_06870 [Brevundimonas sp.]|nr:hypothetical protein [Brevundimonas sp.]